MTDGLHRARRQLTRRRSLRRWVPAAVVGALATLGAGSAVAWVSPMSRNAATVSGPTPAQAAASARLARSVAALRQVRASLASADAAIGVLPRLVIPAPAAQSIGAAPAGQATGAVGALPALAPVRIPGPPPAVHATTGASGVP